MSFSNLLIILSISKTILNKTFFLLELFLTQFHIILLVSIHKLDVIIVILYYFFILKVPFASFE
jgi:hypothetical protein